MRLLYLTDPSFALHDTGMWHPERPARLEAVRRGVALTGLEVVERRPPPVDRALLEAVHEPAYIDAIERFCRAGGGALDPDTLAVAESWPAALRAAGAGPHAVDMLIDGPTNQTAFLAVRPPGHHALSDRAMGFCLFNNVAVTAAALVRAGSQVAILDWDVHHGNGTQAMFDEWPDVLYISLHQYPFYPGGGAADETGIGSGKGTVVNLPMPPETGGDVYEEAFRKVVVPALDAFQPDWILISAGFDAHDDDPLAELRLRSSDYRWMGEAVTEMVPPSRVVVFLEGGYHLAAVAASVAGAVTGLLGMGDYPVEDQVRSPSSSWEMLDATIGASGDVWGV